MPISAFPPWRKRHFSHFPLVRALGRTKTVKFGIDHTTGKPEIPTGGLREKQPSHALFGGVSAPSVEQVAVLQMLYLYAGKRRQPCAEGIILVIVVFDESDELIDGFILRNILFHTFLLLIERYFVWSCTDIAIVGISHLTGTIDDTAHDSYLECL